MVIPSVQLSLLVDIPVRFIAFPIVIFCAVPLVVVILSIVERCIIVTCRLNLRVELGRVVRSEPRFKILSVQFWSSLPLASCFLAYQKGKYGDLKTSRPHYHPINKSL